MATYHLEVKNHSRATLKGSIVRAVAYRTGTRQRDAGDGIATRAAYRSGTKIEARDGRTYDYTRKGRDHVIAAEIHGPQDMAERFHDRGRLWREVEAAERKKDGTPRAKARLAKEIIAAIPRELSDAQAIDLGRGWVNERIVDRFGTVADISWHKPRASDGKPHLHMHVLIATREAMSEQGFGKKLRALDSKETLLDFRRSWEEHVNWHLREAGRAERVDGRSLKARFAEALVSGDFAAAKALDREPLPKLGPQAVALERKGQPSERGEKLRVVRERNTRTRMSYEKVEGLGERGRRLFLALRARAGSAVKALEMWHERTRRIMARVAERLMPERARQRHRDAGLDLGL